MRFCEMPIDAMSIFLKKSLVYFVPLFFTLSLYAQAPTSDSLEALLAQHLAEDTLRVDLLNETAEALYRINIDKTLKYAEEAVEIARAIGYSNGEAEGNRLIGIYHRVRSDYPKALASYQVSLKLFQEIDDPSGISKCLSSIGNISLVQGDYPKALDYLQRALILFEQIGELPGVAKCLNSIGNIYLYHREEYTKALDHYQRALTINEELDNKRSTSINLNNIGIVYKRLGDYPKALEYYQKVLEAFKELNYKQGISGCLNNIGTIYYNLADYPKALEYHQEALEVGNESGYRAEVCKSYQNIGKVYLHMGNYEKALGHTLKSLEIAEEDRLLDGSKNANAQLSQIYVAIADYKKAYGAYVKFKEINDRLFNEENVKKITGLEYQYKYEKQLALDSIAYANSIQLKDVEISRQNTRQYALVGILLGAMITLLVLFIGFARIRSANRLITRQKKEIQKTNDDLNQANHELHATLENLKQAQAQLIHAEKMAGIGQLTAGIAHEINNPVNYITASSPALKHNFEDVRAVLGLYEKIDRENIDEILGEVNDLKEEVEFEEVIQEIELLLANIKSGGDKVATIVQTLRTFSRLDEDALKSVNLHENIDATITMLNNRLSGGIAVEKRYGEVPKIECFPGKLNQVFLSILNNAIDAVEGEGKIIVQTAEEAGNCKILISDTGKGIPGEIRDKIFTPFFTTKDVGEGKGLGLSIAHTIIKEHDGKIEVESKVEKGTTFMIILPIFQKKKE